MTPGSISGIVTSGTRARAGHPNWSPPCQQGCRNSLRSSGRLARWRYRPAWERTGSIAAEWVARYFAGAD